MNTITITTSQNVELDYDLGSLGDRILGHILDWLVIAAYAIILIVIFNFGIGGNFLGDNPWLVVVLVMPPVFYDLVCETLLNGQSVGKMIMGIKVISLNGEQPAFSQYLIRWLFRLVDFSIMGGLIALITVAVNERKQRVGDLVAGTTVVKTKPRTHFNDTLYVPTPATEYKVIYPEVMTLKDGDIQLIKEVLIAVSRSGNTLLAVQAQQKIEQVLKIRSQHSEAIFFLQAVLADYNYLTSQM